MNLIYRYTVLHSGASFGKQTIVLKLPIPRAGPTQDGEEVMVDGEEVMVEGWRYNHYWAGDRCVFLPQ